MRWSVLLLLSAGCQKPPDSDADVAIDTDSVGPEIAHTPITGAQPAGQDILVDARARDGSAVFVMEVLYRQEAAVEWKVNSMMPVGTVASEDEGGSWTLFQGRIRGVDLGPEGMRYFLSAVDASQAANQACLPVDCHAEPWSFAVE